MGFREKDNKMLAELFATRIIEFREDGLYDKVETYDEYLENNTLKADK